MRKIFKNRANLCLFHGVLSNLNPMSRHPGVRITWVLRRHNWETRIYELIDLFRYSSAAVSLFLIFQISQDTAGRV